MVKPGKQRWTRMVYNGPCNWAGGQRRPGEGRVARALSDHRDRAGHLEARRKQTVTMVTGPPVH